MERLVRELRGLGQEASVLDEFAQPMAELMNGRSGQLGHDSNLSRRFPKVPG